MSVFLFQLQIPRHLKEQNVIVEFLVTFEICQFGHRSWSRSLVHFNVQIFFLRWFMLRPHFDKIVLSNDLITNC